MRIPTELECTAAKLCDRVVKLEDENKALRHALSEIADIVDGKGDCSDDADGIARVPNDAMRIEMILDALPKEPT